MRVLDDSRLPDSEVLLPLEPAFEGTGIILDFPLFTTYPGLLEAELDDETTAKFDSSAVASMVWRSVRTRRRSPFSEADSEVDGNVVAIAGSTLPGQSATLYCVIRILTSWLSVGRLLLLAVELNVSTVGAR